jgi:hypothetical protein
MKRSEWRAERTLLRRSQDGLGRLDGFCAVSFGGSLPDDLGRHNRDFARNGVRRLAAESESRTGEHRHCESAGDGSTPVVLSHRKPSLAGWHRLAGQIASLDSAALALRNDD